MKTVLFVLIGMFVACGLAIVVHGKGKRDIMREDEVESISPRTVGDFNMVPGQTTDPNVSYKMDEVTYQTLDPFGIVCRVLSNPNSLMFGRPEAYDTVFIVGDGEHVFHTPEICFQTQGNEILKQEVVNVPTKTRGDVPATLLEVKNLNRNSIGLAIFTFQGPKHMQAGAPVLEMLWNEFWSGSPKPCAFYRFMPQWEGTDPNSIEKLKTFMGDYLDEIHRTSNGRF